MIIPAIITLVSIYLLFWSIKTSRKLQKYEFENRSPGGVVEFENFKDSIKHEQKKIVIQFTVGIGMVGLVVGLMWFYLVGVV